MTNPASKLTGEASLGPCLHQAAQRVLRRCDELAACSDRAGEITRLFCSPAMRAAQTLVRDWMQQAGLACRLDPAGNLIGWLEVHGPEVTGNAQAKPAALLIGSHLDSVINAGKYDGPLGVLLGLALAEIAVETQSQLPLPLEVIGFCEEEGVRYDQPFFGSRAVIGDVSPEWLAREDVDGVALADALRGFGGHPDRLTECVYQPGQIAAFVEPHIEQGPTLEQQNLPVGVVTGAVGQTRAGLQLIGRAGHAGTVSMNARRDALAGAAEWMVEVERLSGQQAGLVATVGHLDVLPNVANVIPGEVRLRLDVRHADDQRRRTAFAQLIDSAASIAQRRGLQFKPQWVEEHDRVDFNAHCLRLMQQAIVAAGVKPFALSSGAGHDAVVMARHFPTAMLFVRCAGGVSHHSDEAVFVEDVAVALEVLWRFVQSLPASPVQTGRSSVVAAP